MLPQLFPNLDNNVAAIIVAVIFAGLFFAFEMRISTFLANRIKARREKAARDESGGDSDKGPENAE